MAEDPHSLLEEDAGGAGRPDPLREGQAGRPPGRAGPPLPAQRGHQVRGLPGGLVQALPVRRVSGQSGVHHLLRRPFHGRDGGHPERAASADHPTQPDRGLLDGGHGPRGRRAGLLGRSRRGLGRRRRDHPDHVHELDCGYQGVVRSERGRGMHIVERSGDLRVGVRESRAGPVPARPAPRAEHRLAAGHRPRRDGRVEPVQAAGRAHA